MKRLTIIALLLAPFAPAFADDAPPAEPKVEAAKTDPRIASLEAQLRQANAIIDALQRQRNQALDQAVLAETRAAAPAAAPAAAAADAKKN
jgi:hypothetical protein